MDNWFISPVYPKSSCHYILAENGESYKSVCGQVWGNIFPDYEWIVRSGIETKTLIPALETTRKCRVCLKIILGKYRKLLEYNQ